MIDSIHETPEEKAKRLGVRLIPMHPKTSPLTPFNPVFAVCGKCGLELTMVMGYVCPHGDCPCFIKAC